MASNTTGARRSVRGRGGLWFYLVASFFFLILELFGASIPGQVRGVADDVVAPVLNLLERPLRYMQSGMERFAGVSDIYQENQDLRDENDRLKQWREAAMQLSRENEQLRLILKVPKREVPAAATARIIGVGGGPFERSVLANAGSLDGVEDGLPVIDENGLIGRVLHTGRWTSRILLITDINSRVPVRLERTGALAIAEGQNENYLRLRFLPAEADIRVGDRVLASGHGGVFPPDLPLAIVSKIDNEYMFLEPIGGLEKLDYVRIMAYHAVPDTDALLLDDDGGADNE
ncbi:MAG: rod shape-determining protein MreC [Kordiimonadaceae bacterium]|nr:rod shape-determining protein MreC [Kordiimonadaceae bacterium]